MQSILCSGPGLRFRASLVARRRVAVGGGQRRNWFGPFVEHPGTDPVGDELVAVGAFGQRLTADVQQVDGFFSADKALGRVIGFIAGRGG